MSFTATHREHHKAAQQRVRDARARVAKARKILDAAGSDPQANAAGQAELEMARGELELAQSLETTILSQMASVASGAGVETFLQDPAVIRELESLATSTAAIGTMNLGPAMSREALLADFDAGRSFASTGTPALGFDYGGEAGRRAPFYGVVPQLRRQLRLLDLIPTASLDNRSLPFVQEVGSLDSAAETPENEIKPTGSMSLIDAEAIARTIAHWVKIPRQQLADVPGIGTAINNRLIYGVKRRLEAQILAGDGTGENILGILNQPGINSVAYTAGELEADATLDAITEVLLANALPTGVVLNPLDWATMLKAKSSGSGEYLSMGPFVSTAQTLWGVDAIPSPVIPQGTALIGDFAIGATCFIREGVNLRISDQDQDDFLRNRCTMLGEGRFALAVWQPAAFAVVSFDPPSGS